MNAITAGFGNTLGSIGLVIGFGVMMGRILEVSRRLGAEFGLQLSQMVGEAERGMGAGPDRLRRLHSDLCGLRLRHLNPAGESALIQDGEIGRRLGSRPGDRLDGDPSPGSSTPGPLGVAGIFGVDIGVMILTGLLSDPVFITGIYYSKWLGKRIYQLPDETGLGWVRPDRPKPIRNCSNWKRKRPSRP